jgi:hypothetical protein
VFVSIKPLYVSVFYSRSSSGGPPLCFVPLQFLPLICVRWVCIITQYVAACVCHLCVFVVLVCWWSACELLEFVIGYRRKGTYVLSSNVSFLFTFVLRWLWKFQKISRSSLDFTLGHVRSCTENQDTHFILVNDQLDAQSFFSIYLFQISTCFEHSRAHHQEN